MSLKGWEEQALVRYGKVRKWPAPPRHWKKDSAPRVEVDVAGLEAELRRELRGEVRFDDGARALYSTDGSNYRQVPIGVVVPKDSVDVMRAIAVCRHFGAPLLSRGGGTSLAGQCCNVAVVMDFSKYMHRVLEINTEERWARVQPGCVLDRLRDDAEKFHLTFGPDPSTHNHCTLGGMLGNNSCGVHSVLCGPDQARTSDNTLELDIFTYDGIRMRVGATRDDELERIIKEGGRRGEIYAKLKALRDKYADLIRERYPKIPRRVSGYNLDDLLPEKGFNVARALVGSESTLVTLLEAKLRLVHSPPARSLLALGYPDVYEAGDHVPDILKHAEGLCGLEGMDDILIEHTRRKHIHKGDPDMLPEGKGWLLVELGGETKQESDARAYALMDALRSTRRPPSMQLFDDPRKEDVLWKVRESGLGATARVPGEPDTWEGWEDSAVHPERLGEYLRGLRKLFKKYDYGCALYGHFGQGCVHTRIDFNLQTKRGIKQWRRFLDDASDLVLSLGGSLSGEHGDGQSRAELLPKMYGPELIQAFREFKAIWDPQGRMNPGKVVDPYPITSNLRLGSGFVPAAPKTHFKFPDDHGSMGYAVQRCVGVGECRREHGGTMCPSYMVTREESASTRGRAHILFEMLQRGAVKGGWRDEHVKSALDLCLSCKGCKSDCPMNVDMATYKAEFLSHYYKGRLRPKSAYSMGLIPFWARLGTKVPGLVNFMTQTPGVSSVMKKLGGIDVRRKVPTFAAKSFTAQLREQGFTPKDGPRVILWADTFNNCFHPEVQFAALEVLESAGFRVMVPNDTLCCGRPLFDYGMLPTAKLLLKRVMRQLAPEIHAGTQVVVLEPSCAATFRDELVNLFPEEPLAKKLAAQTVLLSEFIQKRAEDFKFPHLNRKAVLHGHCHQKSVMGMDHAEDVLARLGVEAKTLDSGCCGMAGSFGYEEGEHYEVSMKAGERVLLPKARQAPLDTLVIADGFSCRSQIEDATPRQALHVAQVYQMALREGATGPSAVPPERDYVRQNAPGKLTPKQLLMAAGVAALGFAWLGRRVRRRALLG